MNENKYLKDFFSKKYVDNTGDTSFYIAFEDCGFHISMLPYTDDISKQYALNVLNETLAQSTNNVIPIEDSIIGHSVSTISDCVELLKATITFKNDSGGNIEDNLTVFGDLKDKLNNRLKSMLTTQLPVVDYYPCQYTPANFMNTDSVDVWTPYEENWDLPSTPKSLPAANGNTDNNFASLKWKIRQQIPLNDIKINLLNTQILPLKTEPLIDKMIDPINIKLRETKLTSLKRNEFNNNAKLINLNAQQQKLNSITDLLNNATEFGTKNLNVTDFINENNLSVIQPFDAKNIIANNLLYTNINDQRQLLNTDVPQQDTQVQSNSIHISFKYCIVNISRPWFYQNILNISQLWYCKQLKEGFFSTGTKDDLNKGKLPSMPVSMILVKDIKITATFSAQDLENAKMAIAFGSLNIAAADFTDLGNNIHSIESSGVQIIGWICEYLPKFPLCNDPALIPNL